MCICVYLADEPESATPRGVTSSEVRALVLSAITLYNSIINWEKRNHRAIATIMAYKAKAVQVFGQSISYYNDTVITSESDDEIDREAATGGPA